MRVEDCIYADYQATTPLDPEVLKKMEPYHTKLFGNPHSADHILGWRSQKAIDKAQKQIGVLIGADPEEIIFTSGATEANNLALFGCAVVAPSGKKRILVSSIEHKSVLETARALSEQHRISVEIVPVDNQGFLNFSIFSDLIDHDVLLVSVMAVNNEIGTIQDLKKIGDLSHHYGALFHCDGAQAPLAMDISVRESSIDLFSLSAHKIYGPKGIGALYVANERRADVNPIIHGGGQQDGLRSGTVPTPLCVGFGEAANKLIKEREKGEHQRIRRLRDRFIQELSAQGISVSVNGPKSYWRHPGNANINFEGYDAHSMLLSLQPKLCAATGAACTSGMIEPSHVLSSIGLSEEVASSAIRFSFGRFSNEQQVAEAVSFIKKAIDYLR